MMLSDILKPYSLKEELCWECLSGGFELGIGGSYQLDQMPSFGGSDTINLPSWQGRDPKYIFSTILEFFLIVYDGSS